jgi:hypothetical protein
VTDHIHQRLAERLKVELSEWVTFVAEDGHRAIGSRERPQTADEIAAALEQTVRDLIGKWGLDLAEDVAALDPHVARLIATRATAVRARTDWQETTCPPHPSE